ncbi:MAG: HAD-IA family hydrolase [Candidatus Micrarchaeota archaeon]
MNKAKIKAFLFDVDGTLVSADAVIHAAQVTMKEFGLRVLTKKEIYEKLMGGVIPRAFPEIYGISVEKALEVEKKYIKNYNKMHEQHVIPHAVEVLRALKKRGMKIGIVTTKSRATAETALKSCGLDYDELVSADDVKPDEIKPSPIPIIKICRMLKIEAENAVMVGDMDVDVIAGKRAGCAMAVGITTGVHDRKKLKQAGADYIIDDLKEILELVK